MVVNAMMVAMMVLSEEQAQSIYHLTSSLRNPTTCGVLAESTYRYFLCNPPVSRKNSKPVRLSRMRFFCSLPWFRAYRLPLEILGLLNIVLCGAFSRRYYELSRKCRYVMHIAELYAPFTLFKGCFEDSNTERLRVAMANNVQDKSREYDFGFDLKSIDWDDYFYRVHIPGVVKYLYD